VAIVAALPQQVYTPRTINSTPAVPANVRSVKATLTRVSWPAGAVLSVEIIYPDGRSAGVVGFDGGPQLARDGSATSSIGIQAIGGEFLPAGVYTVRATVLQMITTAVTIEAV
jgi:hypothetical protein